MAVDDIFPPRDLGGKAEQWGRTVEGEVRSAQKELQQVRQTVQNQNNAQAGTLQTLSDQVAELMARRTYTASDGDYTTNTMNSNESSGPVFSRIDFTLDAQRRVLFMASANGSGFGSRTSGTNSLVLRIGLSLYLYDSADNFITGWFPLNDSTVQYTSSGPARYHFSGGPIVANQSLVLPAGSYYTVLGGFLRLNADTGTGYVENFSNIVQVLEKA